MKKLILILCVSIAVTGCLKGKKIVYTNPEKNISVEISEDQLSVTGVLTLGDGSHLTVSEDGQ